MSVEGMHCCVGNFDDCTYPDCESGRAKEQEPERRKGKNKLVYNKETQSIDTVPSYPQQERYTWDTPAKESHRINEWDSDFDSAERIATAHTVKSAIKICNALNTRVKMEELKQAAIEFEQFLNEPPDYEDKYMVREYRHQAYPKWLKVSGLILAALKDSK